MCGIVGVISYRDPVDHTQFASMRDVFDYRGPDDADSWFSGDRRIALGHRRLSIIDPRPSGKQPMLDEDTGNRIVFNGEVYNYLEIRESLRAKGVRFHTDTDTEVILKAYAAYGIDCLSYFNGMFAIAIWDAHEQHLFVARDRLGIKPLYYYQNEGEFVFASEVKAIRVRTGSLAIKSQLVDQYMSFGYVPGEATMLEGVNRLMPGHAAILKNGNLDVYQYWNLSFDQSEDHGFEYYLQETKSLLLDSINLRLRSDVPLGIFLSGGIDSSAVVGLLADKVNEPLKTFSVAYDFGKEYNETYYARLVSQKFSTDHHEIFVKPDDFRDFIPNYVRLMDEPVTEAAAISLYFVSKLAQDHVTVVLSGEGSDEIFGGYDLYRYMMKLDVIRNGMGAGLSSFIANIANGLPLPPKVKKYATMLSLPLRDRYRGISTYDINTKSLLYNEGFASLVEDDQGSEVEKFIEKLFDDTRGLDNLSQMLYFDTKTWLVDDLLIKADRMSMAASLELRVPFLDYRLVEFAGKIPNKYKVANGQGKNILKKMMEGLLPREVIYRKKMGFPTPLSLMFRESLRDYSNDTLLSSNAKINQFFNRDAIVRLLEEHAKGMQDHHRVLWQLLVLEEWLYQH